MDVETVLVALVERVPAAAADIAVLRERWAEGPPVSLLFATVGKRFAQEAASLPDVSRLEFFQVVEQALQSGEDSLKDAICTGLLEAVVAEAERQGANPDTIIAAGGPLARAYLRAWDEMTGVGQGEEGPAPPGAFDADLWELSGEVAGESE